MLVSLELLKKHVYADDLSGDDEILSQYLSAAEAWVVKSTNRDESELTDADGHLYPQLVQAVLLLAGHWYNQREAVSGTAMSEAPYTIQALIKPFRKLV